jgi:hypothetical protein
MDKAQPEKQSVHKGGCRMTDEQFYMQLCYQLITKYCKGHVEIPIADWDSMHKKYYTIKHRYNKKNDTLEVVAFENDKVN